MKGLFLLFLAFLAFSLSGRNVNLEFLSPTDRYAYDLASFQGINSLSFRIVTDSSGAEYDLVAVEVWPDSVVERHVGLLPVRLHTDTMEVNVFAKALDAESAKVAIPAWGVMDDIVRQPTAHHILIECIEKDSFCTDDEIPLFAYSGGRPFKVSIGGEIMEAYQFCDVRNSGMHPSAWGKEFNLLPYTYYLLRPRCVKSDN